MINYIHIDYKAILQMAKDMAKGNINIDCFKRVTKKFFIQTILLLRQISFNHGVPK